MIYRTRKAKQAKLLGWKVLSKDSWDSDKIDVMRTIVTEKFLQNPEICKKLVATGQDNLIEATTDGFWGAKAVLNSKSIKNATWTGSNVLGKILCEVRDEMRREMALDDDGAGLSNTPLSSYSSPSRLNTSGSCMDTSSQLPQQQQSQLQTQTKSLTETQGNENGMKQTPNVGKAKKNKNRQSPIISSGDSENLASAGQQKKARFLSPSAALPPRKQTFSDLFNASCSAVDEVLDPVSEV